MTQHNIYCNPPLPAIFSAHFHIKMPPPHTIPFPGGTIQAVAIWIVSHNSNESTADEFVLVKSCHRWSFPKLFSWSHAGITYNWFGTIGWGTIASHRSPIGSKPLVGNRWLGTICKGALDWNHWLGIVGWEPFVRNHWIGTIGWKWLMVGNHYI